MKLIVMLLVAVMATPVAYASADEPPSEASIKELLVLTNSNKMLDGIYDQIQANMRRAAEEAMGGKELTPEQQKVLEDMRAKMVAMLKKEMSWESLEPTLIDVYRKSFTKSEIQGMVDFYKSPSGHAVIAKMPAVMQASMQATQGRMMALMPKVKELMTETGERLNAVTPANPPDDKNKK